MTKKIYIVRTSGKMHGEDFDSVLGVFREINDAKKVMLDDIQDIKKEWQHINFDNPKEWEGGMSDDGLSFEGYTPDSDYSYACWVGEHEIK